MNVNSSKKVLKKEMKIFKKCEILMFSIYFNCDSNLYPVSPSFFSRVETCKKVKCVLPVAMEIMYWGWYKLLFWKQQKKSVLLVKKFFCCFFCNLF